MSGAAEGRAHLSIGEVLSLLQDEFPDVTISKIRFLESQGLLDPERTPSGYRKFYDDDIERLRWILRLQKDHYLPLKVIKDRLDEMANGRAPDMTSHNGASLDTAGLNGASTPRAESPRLLEVAETTNGVPSSASSAAARRAVRDGHPVHDPGPVREGPRRGSRPVEPGRQTRGERRAAEPPGRQRPPSRTPEPTGVRGRDAPGGLPAGVNGHASFDPGADAVSLTAEELAEASGLSLRDIRDLERFGLIEPRDGGTYDGDALVVARTAAGFLQHGIEARHMRTYKVAVDREAGLFQQIVSPVLKQRNPEARTRANRTVTELIRLGEVMRGVLLRRELREHMGGG